MDASINTSLMVVEPEPAVSSARLEEMLSGIADRLQSLADDQVRRKSVIEQRWVEDLRAYHGRYDPRMETDLKAAMKSASFVRITRKKTNNWYARIVGLLFPTDDRNWGIAPTPVPKLEKKLKQAEQARDMKLIQANVANGSDTDGGADPEMAAAHAADAQQLANAAMDIQAEIAEAKKRADAMQEEMDDQLVECHYNAEARDAVRDLVRIGTGVMKGPMVKDRSRGAWTPAGEPGAAEQNPGSYMYQARNDPAPTIKRVDPWSFFPDMSATTIEEAEFTFERHLWTRRDLRKLVKERGFSAEAVRSIMRDDASGPLIGSGMEYLTQLRGITGDGEGITGRYVAWEYHGPLEVSEVATIMRAMGKEAEAIAYEQADDPLDERRVILYFCQGQILNIAPEYPLDSGETLYSVATFEPGEASMFGYGVPNIMADSQRAVNSSWRMMLDNGGLSASPQVIIDKSAIEPQDGDWTLRPGKKWLRKKSAQTGDAPAFEIASIPSNVGELMTIFQAARRNADDETALPPVADGEVPEGQGPTATATQTASAGSNVIFRSVVKAWDDGMTTPSLRRLYDWNMQFNPRDDIKGDMSIDARGTSVLLVREIMSQILMQIVTNWLANPAISPMLNPFQLVRKCFQAMQIDPGDVMLTEDQFNKMMTEQASKPPEDPPAVIAANARLEAQTIQSQTALQIANIDRETEIAKLSATTGMSIEKIKAELIKVDMKVQSDERKFAGEIGFEKQQADEARARGAEPTGSGGYVSNGSTPR